MPSFNILRSVDVKRSARVVQLEGLFDVKPANKISEEWNVDIPIEQIPWNVGLIVGPSGSGKTTVANELFPDLSQKRFEWSQDASIIDSFPAEMSIKEITMLLSSVGFSSPPSWMKPFHVLSNGEQFRVFMARMMAENKDTFLIDEFTSVVDRTVAKIGSAAIAKAVRRRNQQFIAVSCHYDIAEWLEPDWIYEPHLGRFARGNLRRPRISLVIKRVDPSLWKLFSKYHYLSKDLNKAAACFCAFYDSMPVAFTAVLSFPHPKTPGYREHRTVCLPDFQGVGIGNALSDFVASCYKAKKNHYYSTTGNPAMIYHRARSGLWKMTAPPSTRSRLGKTTSEPKFSNTTVTNRLVAGFKFVGMPNSDGAKKLKII